MVEKKRTFKPGDVLELSEYEKQLIHASQEKAACATDLMNIVLNLKRESSQKANDFWNSLFVRHDIPEGVKLNYIPHREVVKVLGETTTDFLKDQLEEKTLTLQIKRLEQRIRKGGK